jgi:hypothetical protein
MIAGPVIVTVTASVAGSGCCGGACTGANRTITHTSRPTLSSQNAQLAVTARAHGRPATKAPGPPEDRQPDPPFAPGGMVAVCPTPKPSILHTTWTTGLPAGTITARPTQYYRQPGPAFGDSLENEMARPLLPNRQLSLFALRSNDPRRDPSSGVGKRLHESGGPCSGHQMRIALSSVIAPPVNTSARASLNGPRWLGRCSSS